MSPSGAIRVRAERTPGETREREQDEPHSGASQDRESTRSVKERGRLFELGEYGSWYPPSSLLQPSLLATCKEECFMDPLHHMLPEDEVFLCGAVLLYGLLTGALVRLLVAWRQRRTA
jgi:hypothetical protein